MRKKNNLFTLIDALYFLIRICGSSTPGKFCAFMELCIATTFPNFYHF